MNDTEIEHVVLDVTTEDDYGLWEITAAARTKFPDADPAEVFTAVQRVLAEMLDRGLLYIYRLESLGGAELAITGDQIGTVISEPNNWNNDGPYEGSLWIGATKKGERTYYGDGVQSD